MSSENDASSASASSGDAAESFVAVEPTALVNRIVRRGDQAALAEMFSIYRPRLWRMVNFRLDPRLQGRIDADDVLQDAWMRAVERIGYFLSDASHSSFIWFRMIVNQTLIELHRRHLGAEKRNAAKDLSIHGGWTSESTSSCISFQLMGKLTSPSNAVSRAEVAKQLDVAVQSMNEMDREILALRHFEELTNSETARVLNMSEQAASIRYVRALGRLKQILDVIPRA